MKQLPLHHPQFQELQASFAEWLTVLGYAESTAKSLPLHLRELLHYLEQQGVESIKQVDRAQVEGFFAYLSERGNRRDGGRLSPAYLAKYRQAVGNLDRYLRETGQWGLSLPPAAIQPERSIKAVLTQEEVKKMYGVCAEDALGLRDRAMLSLFYGCGLRRSEGIGLDTEDILLDKGLVYVRKGKNYRERYVPMGPAVSLDIRKYLEEARPQLLAECPYSGRRDRKALLISSRGKRVNDRTLTLRIRSLQEKTENAALIGKQVSLHGLRHAIATHLLERGMKLARIARFLGHAKLESTQIYTHLVNGQL